MTDDLPVALDDYRDLAAFIEKELREPKTRSPEQSGELWSQLVSIYVRVLEEPGRALEFFESILTEDPGDDALRRRYVEIANSLGAQLRAAEQLGSTLERIRARDVRERVALDIGTLYLQEAELQPARNAFLEAVLARAGGPAGLAAARRLLDLESGPGDSHFVGPALKTIAEADPDPATRREAARRLASLREGQAVADGQLVAWLEQAERWEDLARVLEADVELAPPAERPAVLARLGQIRLGMLGDPRGALDAFRACLTLDPLNGVAREVLESLMANGDQPLAVAEILEAVYRQAQFHEGLQRVLEIRVEGTPDIGSRLALLDTAIDLALGPMANPQRAMELCGRGLGEALASAPELVLDWLLRLERIAGSSKRHDKHAAVLLGLLGDRSIESVGSTALAISAVEALRAASAPDQALVLARRALEASPSSPQLLRHLDDLLQDREPAQERLTRYEAALRHTTAAGRRRSLMHTIATIRRDSLGDLSGAVEVWRTILRQDPTDQTAHTALVGIGTKLGGNGALEIYRELIDKPSLRPSLVQTIADAAMDADDRLLYRRALELLVTGGDAGTRQRALERLGDFQFAQLGDRRAAVESWKPAAGMCGDSPAERAHAQSLYERILEVSPEDRDVARQLTELYVRANDWAKLPNVLRVLVRADDCGRVALLLVGLEKGAIEAGAVDEFVSLVDECGARLGADASPSARDLKRTRARALASDPAREEDASLAYRQLIDAFESDEDIRQFEAFVESRPSAEDRHRERRWLYEWRVTRGPCPCDVLLDWAKAEEEYGEPDAAIAVYQRLVESDQSRTDILEVLCRLKLQAGDYEGGLAALRLAAGGGRDKELVALSLSMARLLSEELGRPVEAVLALAPWLGARPPIPAALDTAKQVLSEPSARAEVAERLEQLANGGDEAIAVGIFGFLVEAREQTAGMTESRCRWWQRLVELKSGDPAAALALAIQGSCEFPEASPLWSAAERSARELGQPDAVASAYHRVLVEGTVEPDLAETLGRRMVAYAGEFASESPKLVDALQRVLQLAPGARWALDRVKLVLGSQARWDELFRLYDGAIEAARNDSDLAELLDEAALAAKDLAREPDRAINYLESIHHMRPEDVPVSVALERQYERQGHKDKLIGLLSERVDACSGFKLRELRRRIASLWLDVGRADEAIAVVERMLENDPVSDVVDLLELILVAPAPGSGSGKRAIALLRQHYESVRRTDDLIRITRLEVARSEDAKLRAVRIKELVGLHLSGKRDAPGSFAGAIPCIQADVAGDVPLAKVAYKALLQHALRSWRGSGAGAHADAQDGAWWAIHELKALLVEAGEPENALRLLSRCKDIPFESNRRRKLLQEAAVLCSERLADPGRAIRIFEHLFDEDPADDVAAECFEHFAKLLAASGRHSKLAALWEEQARIHADRGELGEQLKCWESAAVLWEDQGARQQAIAAYRHGAALESHASFEALARIHTARGQWDEAASALEWLYVHSLPEGKARRALVLSEAYVELNQRERARACLEDVLAPKAAAAAEARDQVSERLTALYRKDAIYEPLARLLSAQAQRAAGPETKLAMLREAAEILRSKLDDAAGAADVLGLALASAPHDGEIRLAFADVLETLGNWDKAATALRGQIEWYGEHRSKERALVHQRLARVLVRADRAEDALSELRVAVEMQPAHPAILAELGRLALQLGHFDLSEGTYRALLLALHHPAQDLEELPPYRAEAFLDLSEIAAHKGDLVRATDMVDSAFDAVQESGEGPERFEEVLGARGRYELLARAVERRVERAPTLGARAIALGDLVALWRQRLGQPSELGTRILYYAEAIGRELEHEQLTDAAAWDALASVHDAPGDEDARRAIIRRRVEVLWRAAHRADESRSRSWLFEAASLCSEVEDHERTAKIYETLFKRDPRDQEVWLALSAAGLRLGRRDRLVALLRLAIDQVPPGSDRSRLRVNLARLLLEDGARSESAITVLSAALDEDPGAREAAELLADVLERQNRFEELVAVLERSLALPTVDGEASTYIDAACRLARALERTGRPKDALPVYESILDRPPLDRETVRALADRLADLGSARLADCLESWIAVDIDVAPGLARRLLELRDRQGDRAGARRALEIAFAATPADRGVVQRLIEAHQESGDDSELLRVLDSAIAVLPQDAELLSVRADIRERTGNEDGALRDLEDASRVESQYGDALVELLTRMADRSAGPEADRYTIGLVDVLLRLHRVERARQELTNLLGRSPSHTDGLERLASLTALEGNWASAAQAYRGVLAAIDGADRDRAVRIALAMADACERAGCPAEAREPLERIFNASPQSREVLLALERICEATGDSARLASLLAARAEQEDSSTEKTRLLLCAARLMLEEANQASSALPLIDAARLASPQSVDAVLLWAKAHMALGRPYEALAALRESVERSRGRRSAQLALVHLEMGRAHLAVDEVVEALGALKSGFGIDCRNAEIAMLLGLVALDLDDERTADRAFSAIATMPSRKEPAGDGLQPGTKAIAYYHLASMAYLKGDLGKTRRLATKAIGEDSGHQAAQALLEKADVRVGTAAARNAAKSPATPA